jgi:hypothetical protein
MLFLSEFEVSMFAFYSVDGLWNFPLHSFNSILVIVNVAFLAINMFWYTSQGPEVCKPIHIPSDKIILDNSNYSIVETSYGHPKFQVSPRLVELGHNIFLVDAFLRSDGLIWALMLHDKSEVINYKCVLCEQVWLNETAFKQDCWSSEATLEPHTNADNRYRSVVTRLYTCPLTRNVTLVNMAFSMVPKSTSDRILQDHMIREVNAFIPIRDSRRISWNNSTNKTNEIAVCSGPQWGFKRSTLELWEWLEYQYIIGATRILFYVTSETPFSFINAIINYSKFMATERKIFDYITILNWSYLSSEIMHLRSQSAVANHCVLMAEKDADLVMYTDIDEFIYTPGRKIQGLTPVIKKFQEDPHLGSLSFYNWFQDRSCLMQNESLQLLSCFIRESNYTLDENRQKFIARPQAIRFIDVHGIEPQFFDGYHKIVMPVNEAHMLHFTFYTKTESCDISKYNGSKTIYKEFRNYGERIKSTLFNNTFFKHRDNEIMIN